MSFGVDRVIIIGQIRLLVGDKEKGTRRKTKTILQSVRVAVINLLFGKDFFFLSHRYTGLDWTHLLRNMVIQHEHPNPINPSKRAAVEEEVTFNPTPCVALNVWQGISLLRSVIYISMWHIPFHSACLGSSGDTSCLFCILFATELCHFLDLSHSFLSISLSVCECQRLVNRTFGLI